MDDGGDDVGQRGAIFHQTIELVMGSESPSKASSGRGALILSAGAMTSTVASIHRLTTLC